ncbi:MAG: saccharopine dehydrogenase NADP-binding domain-containing protein [Pseudomonadota bacterium]
MTTPSYTLIVFGATSFVGQILCRYLLDEFGDSLSWAAAGRSRSKLEQLRRDLGEQAAGLPLIIAESSDETSLRDMCDQTGVIVSTVGPYALYGEPLVKVCAESGTDYCDLTGEVQWVGAMIRRYETTARASGARIVHCCGFDSIPSDLGVHFLQREARRRFGQPCTRVKLRIKAMKGGVSGGTIASMLNIVEQAAKNKALRRELANPYSLCPPDHGFTARQQDHSAAQYDADFKSWIAPFVMAGINTRVVHRSNALSGKAYGEKFVYDEASMTRSGVKGSALAHGMAIGIGGFMLAAAVPPLRRLLQERVLPKPGEGPSPAAQLKGYYDFRFLGTTDDGRQLRVKVTGDRDPGYGSTGKMLGQAAVCLARDIPKAGGGFFTPATLLGDKLIKRLCAHAGLAFTVLEPPAS